MRKQRSLYQSKVSASLVFIGQVTKHTTVKAGVHLNLSEILVSLKRG